jgi:hypothetical protein
MMEQMFEHRPRSTPEHHAQVSLNREAASLCEFIAQKDFCFLPAAKSRRLLGAVADVGADEWQQFAQSWDRLELDTFMGDGGRYRYRRHGVYSALPSGRRAYPEAPQPHYQSLNYNHLNGGVPRHFEPIEPAVGKSEAMSAVLTFCCEIFGRLAPYFAWHIEVHQFRITATTGGGLPTPEGMHRDGVNFVFMMLMNRQNVCNGESKISDRHGERLAAYTMATPFDVAIVNDERVLHGVTPIEQIEADQPAYRDMLVVTFCKK